MIDWDILTYKTKNQEPFLFVIDYKYQDLLIYDLPINPNSILIDFPNYKNIKYTNSSNLNIQFDIFPLKFNEYLKSFNIVMEQIRNGNTFLLNLTHKTKIESNFGLKMLFHVSKAFYRLYIPGLFTVFSPETFIKIINSKIYSYPMKGTIDESIPNAEQTILENIKETEEHSTIVDLIRNDLNIVSKNVRVNKFRYIDKINTHKQNLLQVSSEIEGELPKDWKSNFGIILKNLLPAGSITGAPKTKTIEIISKAENDERGFYTGIMGVFDGENIDSSVMIRFVEQTDNGLFYHSGGGITINSNPKDEYQELINKIYVPIA